MVRILTVDDSRAIRQIVSKQLADLGFEIEEAEDGVIGLEKATLSSHDLILLDVTMPNLDGVGMLEQLRGKSNKTPVIMLTSESKRSVIAAAMKLGIDDYILKPFKQEELRAKVLKALKMSAPASAADAGASSDGAVGDSGVVAQPRAASAAGAGPVSTGTRQFIDILVVDDMETVPKKLRTLIPPHVSLNNAASAHDALSLCRERIFRVVIVDMVIPDVNSVTLMNQMRALQPHASFLALMLRTTNDPDDEVKEQGFNGFLFKPFDSDGIDDFIVKYFDNQDLLTADNNVLRPAAFAGKEERLEKYYGRLGEMFKGALLKLAEACFEDAIIDLSLMPIRPDRTARMVVNIAQEAKKMGIGISLVGPPDAGKALANFTDTAKIPFFSSLLEAQQKKAS